MITTKVGTLIVGAGISGRLAALMDPNAVIIEGAQPGTQRAALFVGSTYLYERIEELKPRPAHVVLGHCGFFQDDARAVPFNIQPLTEAVMNKVAEKKFPWHAPRKILDSYKAAIGIPKRYDLCRDAWTCDMPEVGWIRWGTKVASVRAEEHRVTCHVDGQSELTCFEYDKLIWTPALQLVGKLLEEEHKYRGPDLVSHPIYYRWNSYGAPRGNWKGAETMYAEYVADPSTKVYRRTIYRAGTGDLAISLESSTPLEGGTAFWPGLIKREPATTRFVRKLESMDIFCAGRFARWDPDEHVHNTYGILRKAMS